MAASAKIHSKATVFKIDTAGGVLTDISDSCNEVNFPEEMEEVECTTFGATDRAYLPGFSEGTLEFSGHWNRTFASHMAALYAAFKAQSIVSATFEYGPEGSDSGDTKYTGECILLSFEKGSSIDDPVSFSASARVTGAVTVTTY
jgi:hypothetical protein